MRDQDKTKEQLVNDLDDARQRAAKLRREREDLNAFTYTVAHDLKRPLSLILGFSDLLMEEYATISREELRKELQFVIQAGRRMNSVIDEMMLLVHVRDREGLKITSLDMGDVVSEALDRLAYIVKRRQAEIVAPDQWPEALGYAPWIEEVWFAYISETLRLGIRPLRIMLGATEQADRNARFWVRVDERNLTTDQRTRVSQVCDSFKPDLVQRIMEKLGGQLGVAQREGRCSELYFTLPSGRNFD
ncbi:MAG: hypothetical protein B6I35_11695 [Anaerolineaceae bacterium 4572_32.2]|nr:MAG: hypothetical protein B6I35_11695 [Anaerolineaceae bacterium 4572_32.2]HEY72616.1 hypothetical protein [Thermoflexia bacterium]